MTAISRSYMRGFAESVTIYAKSWDGNAPLSMPTYEIQDTSALKHRVQKLLDGYKESEKSGKAVRHIAQACVNAIQALEDKRKEAQTVPSSTKAGKLRNAVVKAVKKDPLLSELQAARICAEKVEGAHRGRFKGIIGKITEAGTTAFTQLVDVGSDNELKHRLWQLIPRYHVNKPHAWWQWHTEGWDWLDTYGSLPEFKALGLEGSTQTKSLAVLSQDIGEFVKGKGEAASPAFENVLQLLQRASSESRKLATARLAKEWDKYVYDYLYTKQEEIRLLKPGESTLIISGTGDNEAVDHAIYYRVTCEENGGARSLSLTLYNTGDEADRYQSPKKKSLLYQSIYFEYDTVTFEGISPHIFEDYGLLRILVGIDVQTAENAQDQLVDTVTKNGGKKKLGKPFHPQGLGNCTYEALLLFLADMLSSKEFRDLQEFIGNKALNKLSPPPEAYISSLSPDKQQAFNRLLSRLKTPPHEEIDTTKPSLKRAFQAFLVTKLFLPALYYTLLLYQKVNRVFGRTVSPAT